MNALAKLAIDAHGGLERWKQFRTVSARLVTGGALWPLKGQDGVLSDVHVMVDMHREWTSHWPFSGPDLRTSFQPHRVAIEATDGKVIVERPHPRSSFKNHVTDTPWDSLQLAYFAGYAMWTYFNTPFLFALSDVKTEEVEPWQEDGEVWRRLEATFPKRIATHSDLQTFYFNSEGLLKRHDYKVDVAGGSPAAHYVSEYEWVSGIAVPTKRRVFLPRPDGTPMPEPLLVSIDLSEIEFSAVDNRREFGTMPHRKSA